MVGHSKCIKFFTPSMSLASYPRADFSACSIIGDRFLHWNKSSLMDVLYFYPFLNIPFYNNHIVDFFLCLFIPSVARSTTCS